MADRLIICSCGGTQSPDGAAIAAATGLECSRLHSGLCTREVDKAAAAIAGGAIIACEQEADLFAALAEEAGVPAPALVDIRDRAGWSADPGDKTPKIAALIALTRLGRPPEKTVDVTSAGMCLVLGTSATALPAAEQLSAALSVTCVVSDAPDLTVGPRRRFDVHGGRLRTATGRIGHFEVIFDGFAMGVPSGRGAPAFAEPRDGGSATCDLILDLRGDAPLFPAHEKRDGYLRADPGDPLAVARAVFDASHMVGTFEKPLHLAFEESLCAHSRARQTACTRCLDLCPTGAITPDGEHVAIDPMICAGCGACSAACPSGAITYDTPPVAHVFRQISTLSSAYRKAGGRAPRLLVHDPDHGREMIALAARFGRGLPADVIPLETPALASFGHAEIMVALATGFQAVDLLLGPKADRAAIEAQVDLAEALAAALTPGPGRIRLLEPDDPDGLSDALFDTAPVPFAVEPILPLGGRRDATRLAARALVEDTGTPIALPAGAPYGTVNVDTVACTLCLSCAGLCPAGALGDNPDMPQLTFQEDACLQCGLCVSVCPEDAITLTPRLDLSDAALAHRVMHEEEPYPCIECGKLFGVKSTIERIVEKLEGQHALFTNSDNARLIRMCDDCRVRAQYHDRDAPFFVGPRPPVRTTDDYRDDD